MWRRRIGRRCPPRLIKWVGLRGQRYRSNGSVGLEWRRNVRERTKLGRLGRFNLHNGNEFRPIEHERCWTHERYVERERDEQWGPGSRARQ
jgi:hypothetical protein